MKTRHNPKIKRLSTAIRRGLKIAEERGIEPVTGKLIKYDFSDPNLPNGKVCGACALGMAYIGKHGFKNRQNARYSTLDSDFGTQTKNSCLIKQAKPYYAEIGENWTIGDVVINLNDVKEIKPDEIADILASCKL